MGRQVYDVWPCFGQGWEWDGADSQDSSRHEQCIRITRTVCIQEKAKDKAKNVEGKITKFSHSFLIVKLAKLATAGLRDLGRVSKRFLSAEDFSGESVEIQILE